MITTGRIPLCIAFIMTLALWAGAGVVDALRTHPVWYADPRGRSRMTRPEESNMFRWIDRGLSVAGRESGVPTGLESGGVIAARHLRGALQIRHPFGVKMPGVHHLQFNGLPDHLHPLLSAWHRSSDTDS